MTDTAALVRALRAYNAARNALAKAQSAFVAALPPGQVVIHRRPGHPEQGWAYWLDARHGLTFAFGGLAEFGCEIVIIDAPGPTEECSPPLPQ